MENIWQRRSLQKNITKKCFRAIILPFWRHRAAANMKIGNDKAFLIKVISQCLPYIGYPRSLNALRCVNNAVESK